MRSESIVRKKHVKAGRRVSSLHPANQIPWSRNLLHTFEELLDHLEDLSTRNDPSSEELRSLLLDAYLTVCALWQILDDYLHRGFLGVRTGVDSVIRRKDGSAVLLDVLPRPFSSVLNFNFFARMILWLIDAVDRCSAVIVGLRVKIREHRLLRASKTLKIMAERIAMLYASVESDTPKHSPIFRSFVVCTREIISQPFPPKLRKRLMKI